MRPRPSIVSTSLATLALVHAWWGAKTLLGGSVLVAGSQLASAGALLLAAVAVGSRRTFGAGLLLAGGATALRLPAIAGDGFGPFAAATTALAAGFALAGWSALRIDDGRAAWEPLALRGGLLLAAGAYAAIAAAVTLAGGAAPAGLVDFGARIAACLAAALFVDAPPARLGTHPERSAAKA